MARCRLLCSLFTYEHGHLPQPTRGPFTSRSVHSLFGCGHNTHHRRRPFDLDSKTALGQLVCRDARNPGGVLAGLPRFGRSPIAVEQVQRAAWPQEALDEVQLLRRATDPEEIGAALAAIRAIYQNASIPADPVPWPTIRTRRLEVEWHCTPH